MEIVLIAHNIRSVHNIGSIFRTAEGFGVAKIYLSGYTPSPDNGLPHVRAKIASQLHKTALGAEKMVAHEYINDLYHHIRKLRKKGYKILGLEQDLRAILLPDYCKDSLCNNSPTSPLLQNDNSNHYHFALVIGEEVNGIEAGLRDLCDDLIEIPMRGQKESFNVAVATGIALYALTTTASAP